MSAESHYCPTHKKTVMLPRPTSKQTYEQRWCGEWFDCPEPGCSCSALIPSAELLKQHEEQRAAAAQLRLGLEARP